jgi:hypothetical protein
VGVSIAFKQVRTMTVGLTPLDSTLLSNDVSFLLPEISVANTLQVLDVFIKPPKSSSNRVLNGRNRGGNQGSGR